MYCTTIETSGHGHEICIGIHMISSAIWGKSAQLNYTKTNPICGLWKILRVLIYPKLHETNSCDYLLLHEKIWLAFPLLRVTACPSSRLQMTTSTKIGRYFDGWILMDNNAVRGNLFTENWRLLSFYESFHCRHGKKYNCDQDYFVLFCFVWVLVEESVATRDSLMAVFVVHASFYSRVREKT